MDPTHAQVIPAEADDSKMILKQLNGVSHGPASVHEKPVNQCSERPTSSYTSSDVACSYDSTSSNPVTDATSAASTEMVPPESSGSNKVSKVGFIFRTTH